MKKIPHGYLSPAAERGHLEVFKYTAIEDRLSSDAAVQHITRSATVYLPYAYDPSEHYNILYMVHGRGGTYKTWLGTADEPRRFKHLLDNMIMNGELEPLIVVCPQLAYRYANDDEVIQGTADEIAYDLMPAVESEYSTYALAYSSKAADAEQLEASRTHRAIGGFSMGGALTWTMLTDNVQFARYYLPMSMAMYFNSEGYSPAQSIAAAGKIAAGIARHPEYDYEIFVGTGSLDHKHEAARYQVKDLLAGSGFRLAHKDFSEGNIMFHEWPGRTHKFTQSFPYVYNGLIRFFK